jgi:hypothetical protein
VQLKATAIPSPTLENPSERKSKLVSLSPLKKAESSAWESRASPTFPHLGHLSFSVHLSLLAAGIPPICVAVGSFSSLPLGQIWLAAKLGGLR